MSSYILSQVLPSPQWQWRAARQQQTPPQLTPQISSQVSVMVCLLTAMVTVEQRILLGTFIEKYFNVQSSAMFSWKFVHNNMILCLLSHFTVTIAHPITLSTTLIGTPLFCQFNVFLILCTAVRLARHLLRQDSDPSMSQGNSNNRLVVVVQVFIFGVCCVLVTTAKTSRFVWWK